MMRSFFFAGFMILPLLSFNGCVSEKSSDEQAVKEPDFSVLIFSKTTGWRHDSIEDGIEAVQKLGVEHHFGVTATENSDYFTDENLSNYDVVLFLNTTETVFNDDQRVSFQRYIQNGGGFAGIHSASDTEYDWPWYGDLVGAYFDNHPHIQEAVIHVEDDSHPATRNLPNPWQKEDEWYNFGYLNDQVNVLLKLDTNSFEGSDHSGDHPIAWYHEYDGGRAFYTGLGHSKESFSDSLYLDHLLGGLLYAAGMEE